jgi:hypothetical protein
MRRARQRRDPYLVEPLEARLLLSADTTISTGGVLEAIFGDTPDTVEVRLVSLAANGGVTIDLHYDGASHLFGDATDGITRLDLDTAGGNDRVTVVTRGTQQSRDFSATDVLAETDTITITIPEAGDPFPDLKEVRYTEKARAAHYDPDADPNYREVIPGLRHGGVYHVIASGHVAAEGAPTKQTIQLAGTRSDAASRRAIEIGPADGPLASDGFTLEAALPRIHLRAIGQRRHRATSHRRVGACAAARSRRGGIGVLEVPGGCRSLWTLTRARRRRHAASRVPG